MSKSHEPPNFQGVSDPSGCHHSSNRPASLGRVVCDRDGLSGVMPSYLFDFAFFRESVDVFLARINRSAFSSDFTAVLTGQLEIGRSSMRTFSRSLQSVFPRHLANLPINRGFMEH